MSRPLSKFKTFLWTLFTENHHLCLSDDELCTLIRTYWPKSLLDKRVGRHRNRLGIWRSEYNRGRFYRPPTSYAFCYYNRVPVTATGRRLSEEEVINFQGRIDASIKPASTSINHHSERDSL